MLADRALDGCEVDREAVVGASSPFVSDPAGVLDRSAQLTEGRLDDQCAAARPDQRGRECPE
jgi:hypothetical protein